MSWDTSETVLKNNNDGKYYQLKGYSLTGTEYAAGQFNNTSWYDFGWYTYVEATTNTSASYVTQYANSSSASADNPSMPGNCGLTLNVFWLMQNIFLNFEQTGNGNNITTPCSAPCIRIPLCADYWLNGSATPTTINSVTSPYYSQGQSNSFFTGVQYQQAIFEIIYYCYDTWTTRNPSIPITFVLDLHWNYASPSPTTSGSYTQNPNSTSPPNPGTNPIISYSSNASSEQLPLCGVCTSDGLGLPDNTLAFWNSVSLSISTGINVNTYSQSEFGTLFTKSTTTTPMPQTLLDNIFLEAYNEPFTERVIKDTTNIITTYDDKYSIYVRGGTGDYNGDSYLFTGMLDIYNTIRNNCANIVIFGGADSYSFMLFNTTTSASQWNSDNTIANTYNCFTTLRDAIEEEGNFTNVIINLHPFLRASI